MDNNDLINNKTNKNEIISSPEIIEGEVIEEKTEKVVQVDFQRNAEIEAFSKGLVRGLIEGLMDSFFKRKRNSGPGRNKGGKGQKRHKHRNRRGK